MEVCTAGSLDMPFILELYQKAFPAEERKPFSVIERKAAMGSVEILLIRESAKRVGLAIVAIEEDLALLDYFAIDERWRGRGFGTEALQVLYALYSDRQVFLEIEEPDEAAPNYQERVRRKNFYIRNGMRETGIHVELFGVRMELLSVGEGLRFEDCEKVYRELLGPLYRTMVKRIS